MYRTLVPIISVLIAAAIVFFYVKPTYEHIKSIQDQTKVYTDATKSLDSYKKELATKLTTSRGIAPGDRDRLDALVPDSTDEVHTLVDLKNLAESDGMLFGNIGVKLASDNGSGGGSSNANAGGPSGGTVSASSSASGISDNDFQSTDISFSVIGTYDQFRTFLHDLEGSLEMLEVTNLTFAATDGPLYQFSFTVRNEALKTTSP